MYTLPFAIVGTVNFTAFPAWSRFAGACALFHISWPRFVASYACKTAGPVPCGLGGPKPPVPANPMMPCDFPLKVNEADDSISVNNSLRKENGVRCETPQCGFLAYDSQKKDVLPTN